MNTGIHVADAMTQAPITVSSNASLLECAKIMTKEHVGALVVKDGEKPLGIFTEQDMVRKGMLQDKPASELKAKEVMEQNLVTITPEEDISDALLLMRDYNIKHLPVVHNNKMIGLVTAKDILKLEPDLFDLLVQKIELRESARKLMRDKDLCQQCGNYSDELEDVDGVLVCDQCKE